LIYCIARGAGSRNVSYSDWRASFMHVLLCIARA
jgi:hypothetical protein